jgi:uncharacterized protein
MTRIAWDGTPEWRVEVAEVVLAEDGITGTGAQIGSAPRPYRAFYEIDARGDWITKRFRVEVAGVGSIELRHDGKGAWTGVKNADDLDGALDVDLAFSPLTNLMPVRRHRLHEQPGTVDFAMAWVSLPDLAVHRSEQRYEHLEPGRVRFSDDSGFVAELELDADGVILLYPELARRSGA